MNSKYLNPNYDGGSPDIPLNVGDRRYGQDRNRDFYNQREYGALIANGILNRDGNTIINGMVVTQGAGHTIDITKGYGVVDFQIKVPTNWSVLPPTIGTTDIPIVVEVPALTNQTITGATTDGVTTNYVKIAYTETFTSTRARAKKAGSYSSETESSYTLTVNSTVPTAYELQIASFTTDGITITFTGNEVRGVSNIPLKTTVKDSNYTILATDVDNIIIANPNTTGNYGVRTITAPATGSAIDRKIRVTHGVNQGLVKIDANGAQKFLFKGNLLQEILLYNPGQYIDFYWDSNISNWVLYDYKIEFVVDYDNRSDWTNVHIGNGVTYDNKSAAVDLTGMVITEATSNFTGVVVHDTGGTGGTGILYVYELSSGFTFWTNNRVLTASNGTTCDINEVSGSSKNVDYALYHGFNMSLKNYILSLTHSTDGTDTNSRNMEVGLQNTSAAAEYGIQLYQIDTNSFKIQTGANGMAYLDDSGNSQSLVSNDEYIYKKIVF